MNIITIMQNIENHNTTAKVLNIDSKVAEVKLRHFPAKQFKTRKELLTFLDEEYFSDSVDRMIKEKLTYENGYFATEDKEMEISIR